MTLDLTNFAFTDAGGESKIVLTDTNLLPHQFVANTICFNGDDIGLFDRMRELYNTGTTGVSDEQKDTIVSILKGKLSPFLSYQIIKHINESV